MFRIRDYKAEDQVEARRLIEGGLEEHFAQVDTSKLGDLKNIYASYIEAGDCFYVAENSRVLIGTLGLRLDEDTAQVVRVVTRRDYRRLGIASLLLSMGILEARKAGIRRLLVSAHPDCADSMAFYLHHGFVACGEDQGGVQLGLDLETALPN